MNVHDELRMRRWSKMKGWREPARTLRDLRTVELQLPDDLDPKARSLRTRGLRKFGEGRQAALFCHGTGDLLGTTIYFLPVEEEAHDYVMMRVVDRVQHFTPLQLKELVPEQTNLHATLDDILADLAKYTTAADTVAAVYINRRGRMDLNTIKIPALTLGELWLFWAASEDNSRWELYGDLLQEPRRHLFTYPSPIAVTHNQ